MHLLLFKKKPKRQHCLRDFCDQTNNTLPPIVQNIKNFVGLFSTLNICISSKCPVENFVRVYCPFNSHGPSAHLAFICVHSMYVCLNKLRKFYQG